KAAQLKLKTNLANNPAAKVAPRFLEFAEKNPKDASAADALAMALNTSGGPMKKNGIWTKIVGYLQANDWTTRPDVKRLLGPLANSNDEAAVALVRTVIAKNPDHKTQGKAVRTLADALENAAQMAERIQGNDAMRKNVEAQAGKEFVEKLIAGAE